MYTRMFQSQVIKSFQKLHGIGERNLTLGLENRGLLDGDLHSDANGEWILSHVGDNFKSVNEVQEGVQELQVSVQIKDHIQGSAYMV